MTSSSKRSMPRTIGTVLALLLLVYWLTQQGWDQILEAIRRIPSEIFILAFGIMMISRFAVTARWYVLLRSAQGGITVGQALRLTFAGLFASNFLPTTIGGDVVRLVGGITLKLDSAMCAASLITDRVIGMLGMATMLPVGLYYLWDLVALNVTQFEPSSFTMVSFTIVGEWTRNVWGRITGFIQRVVQALLLWVRNPRAIIGALIFTWMHMLCLFVTLGLLIHAIGEEMNFWLIGGLWSIVYCNSVTLLSQRIGHSRNYANFFLFEYRWNLIREWIDTCPSHSYVDDARKFTRDRVPADDHKRSKTWTGDRP